jgi:glycosyltransferase involved in cell wall biosynthesis
MKKPSITVVIATYNAALTVTSAVESVLNQDYPGLDLLIIDGASTDNTLELVNSFTDSRMRVLSEPDRGIYDAWNKGAKLSTSDRILFIGADDTINGNSAISDFWNRACCDLNDAPIVYGDLAALSVEGDQIGVVGSEWRDPWAFSGRHLWSSFKIPIMATFFDRRTILDAGLFDASLKIMADINLVLKVAKKIRPIYVPGSVVTLMGFGGISTRPEAGKLAMREGIKIRRIHGLGAYTNLEFLARLSQYQVKYLISKHLGPKAEKKMVNFLHKLKKIIYDKRKRNIG